MSIFQNVYNFFLNPEPKALYRAEIELQNFKTLSSVPQKISLGRAISSLNKITDPVKFLSLLDKNSSIIEYLPTLMTEALESTGNGNNVALTNLIAALKHSTTPLNKKLIEKLVDKVLINSHMPLQAPTMMDLVAQDSHMSLQAPTIMELAAQEKLIVPLKTLKEYVFNQASNDTINKAVASYLEKLANFAEPKTAKQYEKITDLINNIAGNCNTLDEGYHNTSIKKIAVYFAEYIKEAEEPSNCAIKKALFYIDHSRSVFIRENKAIALAAPKLLKLIDVNDIILYRFTVKDIITGAKSIESLTIKDIDLVVEKIAAFNFTKALDFIVDNNLLISEQILNHLYVKSISDLSKLQKFKDFADTYSKIIANDKEVTPKFMEQLNSLSVSAYKLMLEKKEVLMEEKKIAILERESYERIEKLKKEAQELTKKMLEQKHYNEIKSLKEDYKLQKALLESKVSHLEKTQIDIEKREAEIKSQLKQLEGKIAVYESALHPVNPAEPVPNYEPSAPPLSAPPPYNPELFANYNTKPMGNYEPSAPPLPHNFDLPPFDPEIN